MTQHRMTVTSALRDTDLLGHVNNAAYITWVETARTQWLMTGRGRPVSEGLDFTLARTEIDYVDSVLLHEQVEVRSDCTRIGNSSFTLQSELWNMSRDCCAARALAVLVCIDQQNKPTPVPAALRQLLERAA